MAANTQKINATSVARYVLLPGVVPRAKALATDGFGYLAFLFACIYRMVRILPATHPYVNPANIGKFGIVQVVTAAAGNVKYNRQNIDQIVVFAALLGAAAILVLQFVLLVVTILSGQAFAQVFTTQYPQVDVALLMLDHVFGIPAITGGGTFFGSTALGTTGPTPFHVGLHALFNFYNLALLLVGVIILLYYIAVVVMETAQTGVPFGRRFSKVYAPIRLIIAVGLMVPLFHGFNGAQYITLSVAKMGSGFATNGWLTYNDQVAENPMGVSNNTLIAKPRSPAIDELAYFASVYHACREMYSTYVGNRYLTAAGTLTGGTCIRPYVIVNGAARLFANNPPVAAGADNPCNDTGGAGTTLGYYEAKGLFPASDIEIVLGERNARHEAYPGNVRPYCGKIKLSLNNNNPSTYSRPGPTASISGVQRIESTYYSLVRSLLQNGGEFRALGERAAHVSVLDEAANCHASGVLDDATTCETGWSPDSGVFTTPLNEMRTDTEQALALAAYELANGINMALPEEMARRGWGGAGMWYNQIADLNGTFTSAVYATPSIKQYPEAMEKVKKERAAENRETEACRLFEPNIAGGRAISFDSPSQGTIAEATNRAYVYFCEKKNQALTPSNGANIPNVATADMNPRLRRCATVVANEAVTTIGVGGATRGQSGNAIVDAISLIFGINGLFDIRNASCIAEATGQPSIHPLAQLSTVGRALVENAIRMMAISLGASFGGGLLSVMGNAFGPALQAISGMATSIATLGLTAGFILYYILPFLPFMYFFFAVGSWVKSIFEAMVGAPLWALAHLHIDGDGLPGRAAMTGYLLLFEIFLRPIVIVLGLIGGIAVFGALATALNNLFDLAILNTTGAIPGESSEAVSEGVIQTFRRGVIDQFFFTIMYTILMYLIAVACFKMIDTIPASFMRWLGSGVPTFNDNKGDPTQNLTQWAAIGGSQISGQVFQGLRSGSQAAGEGLGAALRAATSNNSNPQQSGG